MKAFVELNKIRLNEEVKGLLFARYKGCGKKVGEPVMKNEVEDILDFKLTNDVSSPCNDNSTKGRLVDLL
jgi:hypothetical protein